MKNLIKLILTSLVFAFGHSQATEMINDARALADLKSGKGVFLVDIGDPKKLNFYLEVIRGTHANMSDQGVQPDFVLVYIGPSVAYLTTDPSEEIENEAGGITLDLENNVAELAKLGVRQEVCAVATRVFGIDNATIFDDMTLVRDGFNSLIGYQAQGYHLVPVF